MPPWTLGPLRSPWSRTRLKAPLQPCVTINQLVLESSLTVTGNEDNCTSYTRRTPRPAFGHSSKMATWHWCGHTNKFSFDVFFFFLFNWNILLIFLSSAFKFPFKGVGFSCLEFLGWIFFFFCGWWGCSDAGVVWFFSYAIHSNHLDMTRLVVYVLYPLSPVYHTTRVRTEPYQPLHYLWKCSRCELPPPILFLTEAHVKCSFVKQRLERNTPPPLCCYSTKFHQAVDNMHCFKIYFSLLVRWESIFFPLCPYIILTTFLQLYTTNPTEQYYDMLPCRGVFCKMIYFGCIKPP